MSTFADQARDSALYILEHLTEIQESIVEAKRICRDSDVLASLTNLQTGLMPIKQECHTLKVALSTARTCGEFRHCAEEHYADARMAAAHDLGDLEPLHPGEMRTRTPDELEQLLKLES